MTFPHPRNSGRNYADTTYISTTSTLASTGFKSSLTLFPGEEATGAELGDLESILCLCGEGD